ncbi:MAG: UDP-N-acetylglucosamine--N-acetylmuramyl-(pentapeptide) pyrophosphoryl-undecaprenol N-acetylglucosamine transferase, partial [Campylobacteraceae bacterium]|nr:UDP-N-acetylglucosamine--N-acetylmuramyl-(pentapeptide) pyrophosphoryl-undecaprenol N-acetylglucosamine transferase [Campylobacteraceae bacterium]
LAKIIRQESVSKEQILDEILNYDIRTVSLNLKDIMNRDGAKKIVDDVLSKIPN